ncbi:hypothetical protein ARMGADRAFT_1031940 [Armillaria gallica]|uniref:Uncharacterized protein n=1 Tax=Armillaria gallica TaxID=47427 RepID=A0A2H3DAY8_ARMGA|nr:hypothetical protein ARMGADRAFT_1031940 [Armillaria gallica]
MFGSMARGTKNGRKDAAESHLMVGAVTSRAIWAIRQPYYGQIGARPNSEDHLATLHIYKTVNLSVRRCLGGQRKLWFGGNADKGRRTIEDILLEDYHRMMTEVWPRAFKVGSHSASIEMAPSMTCILVERATRREDNRIFEVVLRSVVV